MDRFWSKVDKSGGPTACWPWKACLGTYGYGLFKLDGKAVQAPRIAYELTYGPLKHNALHRCDNRPCCNPRHIYDGTSQDNIDDMDARGRRVTTPGELNASAKLTRAEVNAIRLDSRSCRAIARDYAIGKSMVSNIKQGKNWI